MINHHGTWIHHRQIIMDHGFISKQIHLQNLIGVKIGHLIVKERYLVDNHGKEYPSQEYKAQGQARSELLPRILQYKDIWLLSKCTALHTNNNLLF